ncbi:MAG: DUF305 domain-containing protein [Thermoanaerobaculia bacterium]
MSGFLSVCIALGMALSPTGCRRNDAATPEASARAAEPPAQVIEVSPVASAAYDLQFLDTMPKHHQMSIDMVRIAEGKFSDKELGRLAKKMAEDQGKENAQMKQWREQWFPGAPNAENMQMPGMASMGNMDMSHMQTASGTELDRMFVDMMVPHHQSGIEMARDALAKAEHQEIRDLAEKMIAKQQKEIDEMQRWKARRSSAK